MSERTIDEVSSSETWKISRDDAKKIHEAFPPRVRRGFNRLQSLIKRAIVIISEEGEDLEYLIGKIDVYYKSEEGRGRFARLACTWLQDEGWTEHEDLWNPDRARENVIADKIGKTFCGYDEDEVRRGEVARTKFIMEHSQDDLNKACDVIISDLTNGYTNTEKILNTTMGRMLLAKQLKG